MCSTVGVSTPEREDRGNAGGCEVAFPRRAYVFEEEIAEHRRLDVGSACGDDGGGNARFVDVVGARRRDLDDVNREAETLGLHLEQVASHRMHRDTVRSDVDGREQAANVGSVTLIDAWIICLLQRSRARPTVTTDWSRRSVRR